MQPMSNEQAAAGEALCAGEPVWARGAPTVSVVIPTYNRVGLLADALDSVAAQTFTDYEIIVVDDGSQDATRDYVTSRPLRIRYQWQSHQGVSAARNHAVRMARAELVAFLDSDDMWEPLFLERTVQWLREHPEAGVVFTDFVSTDPRGGLLRGHRKRPWGGDITPRLFASTFIATSALVARTAVVREAGGFDTRLTHNEDLDLWLRLSLRHRFGLILEPLCRRRCHPESLSRNGCSPDILLRKAELLREFCENSGKAKIPAALARRRLARLYYTAGKAFVRAGRAAEACQILRRSLADRPVYPKAWFWRFRAEIERAWRG